MSQPPIEGQDDLNQDDSFQCIICSENWTRNGPHCKISLRCGHLFGERCISQWIEKSRKGPKCPICLNPIKKKDLRRIKTPRIVVRDLAERNKLALLSAEKEAELAACQKAIDSIQLSILMCRREYERQSSDICNVKSFKNIYTPWRDCPLELPLKGGRALSFDCRRKIVALTLGSNIQKINLSDMSLFPLISYHTGTVRDVKCSSQQSMILSTGLDKTLRLTSITDGSLVHTYALESAGWCCAVDEKEPNIVYCGMTNDAVVVFDIRNTGTHVQRLQNTEVTAGRPIHSLSVRYIHGAKSLLCSNLEGVYLWDLCETTCNIVTMEENNHKPFSLSVDESDPQDSVLVSLRKAKSTRHVVGRLNGYTLNTRWAFETSTEQNTLARTSYISRSTGTAEDSVVCYANEPNETLSLRNQAGEITTLNIEGPALDIKRVRIDNEDILAALSSSHLHLLNYT